MWTLTVFFVGGQEAGKIGRGGKDKKLVIIAIEKKNRGISRMYCKVIDKADSDSLGDFMKQTVDFQANIKTDGWQGYSPLKKDFEHLQAYIDEYTYCSNRHLTNASINIILPPAKILLFLNYNLYVNQYVFYLEAGRCAGSNVPKERIYI